MRGCDRWKGATNYFEAQGRNWKAVDKYVAQLVTVREWGLWLMPEMQGRVPGLSRTDVRSLDTQKAEQMSMFLQYHP